MKRREVAQAAYEASEGWLVGGALACTGLPAVYGVAAAAACPGRVHCGVRDGCPASGVARCPGVSDPAALALVACALAAGVAAALCVLCASGSWSLRARRAKKVAALCALALALLAAACVAGPAAGRVLVVPYPLAVAADACAWRVVRAGPADARVAVDGCWTPLFSALGGADSVQLTVTQAAVADEDENATQKQPQRAFPVRAFPGQRAAPGVSVVAAAAAANATVALQGPPGLQGAAWNVTGLQGGAHYVLTLAAVDPKTLYEREMLAWRPASTLSNGQKLARRYLVDVRPFYACTWSAVSGCI